MISLIAAIGKNNELGKNNDLIWHLPNDLKFFKEVTMNKNIIMGYKTYLSLPGKLKGRHYIVLTSKDRELDPDIDIYHSKEELLNNIKDNEDYYVIGGASIYEQLIDVCDRLYLTEIDAESDADVYFPSFDTKLYTREVLKSNSDNGINYNHVLYKRR